MTKQPAGRTPRPRRWVLLFILALLFLGAGVFLWGEERIETQVMEVTSPRLPAAFDGFRVVQLSDVHNKEFGPDNRRLLDHVAGESPDLIVITGDLISRWEDLDFVPALAKGLAAIAPTYYVTGNHEWASGRLWELKPLLRECGVVVLENEYVVLERDGAQLALAGAEDPNGRADQKTPEELCAEVRADLGEIFTLLLAHRNTLWETYDRCGVDVTLSGHAHGGVVRIPFTEGLVGPNRDFFPSHTGGLYTLPGGSAHVVSRGLGGVRLFNRPHLPVLVLRAG